MAEAREFLATLGNDKTPNQATSKKTDRTVQVKLMRARFERESKVVEMKAQRLIQEADAKVAAANEAVQKIKGQQRRRFALGRFLMADHRQIRGVDRRA